MKRRLLFTLFALLTISSAAWAAIGDSWEVTQGDGKIKYTVITEPSGGNNGTVFISKGSTNPTGDLDIPETVTNGGKTYTVTELGKEDFRYYAFQYCSGLTSVSIPDGVTAINTRAFQYCSGLKSINIPSSVKFIGGLAFADCTELMTSITIPDGVETISSRTFIRCTSLESVTIGSGVTEIHNNAFYGCTNLTSITIPDNVKTIGDVAFQNCTNLKSVSIGSGVTEIGGSAFADCTNLTSITIPDNVETIANTLFNGCTGLESITVGAGNKNYSSDANGVLYDKDQKELILYPLGNKLTTFSIPDGVETIGLSAFNGCTGLKSVTIGSGVETIEYKAFADCTNLTRVTIPDGVETIEQEAFKDCSGLTSVSIGSGVTEIDYAVFNGCTSLESVTIPDNVETIGQQAFNGCTGLESVTIGNGVTLIDQRAFNGCASLTSIICMPTDPPSLGASVFDMRYPLEAIYVPRASLEAYKTAWIGKVNANAEFKSLTYAVSAKANAGGSASATPSGTDVLLNTAVTFTATPDDGYKFVEWTDDNNADATVSTDAVYTVKLDRDMALTAHFRVVTLSETKAAKQAAIDKLFGDYNEGYYRPEQWNDLTDLFEEAKKAVSEATTVEQVDKVDLDKLKADADAIPTDAEMTAATQAAFNEAKAALQAAIDAAEDKRAEEGYETQYTSASRQSVLISIANGMTVLRAYANSTENLAALTLHMQDATEAIYSALAGLVEETPVGVESVEGSEPFVRVGNTLRFAAPTEIAVYSTSGRMMFSGTAEEYTLPSTDGIYILRTADGSWKLARR